jgi:drug/metabolite transporter (DMT)-like permease
LTWAYGSLRASGHTSNASPLTRSALQMMFGGGVMGVISLGMGEVTAGVFQRITPVAWGAYVYLATFGSILVGSAYLYLLTHVSPSRVSTYAYVNPVIAVILGALIARETISAQAVAGGLIIVMGVALTLSQRQSPARVALANE